ncbi:hypothetical protein [Micromonospora sp. URMC 103]|uniref:hypothetical protein n=1 Tax=Micromonospora sp. URMC 103 TaxID=3423406 RepID=UPI003F1C788C
MTDQPPTAVPPPGQPDPPGPHPGWSSPPGPHPGWSSPSGPPPVAGPYPGQHWHVGQPAGWYPPGLDPADPLVTPPGAGLGGWYQRCVGAVQRGWRVLLPLLLLTQVLPAAVLSVITLGVDPSARWETSMARNPSALPETFFQDLATVFLVSVVGSVLIGLVQSLGWAAGTWVLARQATGAQVDLGTALRYGVRRMVGLWGWALMSGLIVAVGLCFCVLPGVYLAFALSMVGPVYLFERQNPIGRSFRMFHQRLGLLLGRVALVVAVVLTGSMVVGFLEAAATTPFGADPLAAPGTAVGAVVVVAVSAVLSLPLQVAQLVGFVVTYAEQRAHEGPVNSAGLVTELG